MRSETEIADALKIPLLGRLTEASKRFRDNGLVMLDEPDGMDAESFRIVRTNLEYVNADRGAQTIMITSSVRSEGKSTTAANLALTFARLGRRVVIVDLDFRRASVHRLFGLDTTVGVSDVVLGNVSLEHAIVRSRSSLVAVLEDRDGLRFRVAKPSFRGGRQPSWQRRARHMPATAPMDPGEFVGVRGIADVLQSLRKRADIVLVDAPPTSRSAIP